MRHCSKTFPLIPPFPNPYTCIHTLPHSWDPPTCEPCPEGYYGAIAGATTCSKCPFGSTSRPGATSCFLCPAVSRGQRHYNNDCLLHLLISSSFPGMPPTCSWRVRQCLRACTRSKVLSCMPTFRSLHPGRKPAPPLSAIHTQGSYVYNVESTYSSQYGKCKLCPRGTFNPTPGFSGTTCRTCPPGAGAWQSGGLAV